MSRSNSADTDNDGSAPNTTAATPATCAAATDVPSSLPNAGSPGSVVPVFDVVNTPPDDDPPGADTSTPAPQFEYAARTPSRVVAPTVNTPSQFAGANPDTSEPALPAAATTSTPRSTH